LRPELRELDVALLEHELAAFVRDERRAQLPVDFINCKVEEEKKAWALIDAGYDGSFTGVAYGSVFFQNSNNSVRVTDEFMRAVLDDGEWSTRSVTSGEVVDT
jgi:ribonucleoside-diphosphate reductase alpha chain